MDYKFFELKVPKSDVIQQITSMEQDAFGDGGMNSWFLPPFVRHGKVFILTAGDLVLAAAEYMRDFSDLSLVYLFGLVVRKEYRSMGLGFALLNRAHTALRQDKIENICLTVDPHNQPALRLYAKLGFAPKQFLKDEYGSGVHRRVLELNLLKTGAAE